MYYSKNVFNGICALYKYSCYIYYILKFPYWLFIVLLMLNDISVNQLSNLQFSYIALSDGLLEEASV